MAEELTQEQKDELAAAEAKKQEEQAGITIPKARFDEVNAEKKRLEDELATRDAATKKAAEEKLAEEGKTKELLEIRDRENAALKVDILKRDLISDAINNKGLNAKLSSMVQGDTEEAIKASVEAALTFQKEVEDGIKADKTATDTGGGSGDKDFKVLSTQEYMELYNKDPAEADKYLKELTARKTKA